MSFLMAFATSLVLQTESVPVQNLGGSIIDLKDQLCQTDTEVETTR